jgi:geranylgeranyl pyrophosphate synthase
LAELTESDVDAVLGLLDAADARTASTAAAERWATAAIELLRPLSIDAPHRADLEALASFFVNRTA